MTAATTSVKLAGNQKAAYPLNQLEEFSHSVFDVDYSVLVGILTELKGRDL